MGRRKNNKYLSDFQYLLHEINYDEVELVIATIWDAYIKKNTIYIVGNGGSASTATHLAADISKNTLANYWNEKEKRFKAISLTDNTAWMTAIGNDYSHEDIFVEQLKSFARSRDILFVVCPDAIGRREDFRL